MCSITTSKQAKEDLKAIILINEFVNLTMEKPSYIIKRGYPLQIFFSALLEVNYQKAWICILKWINYLVRLTWN